jgi:hypothetical protein
MAETTGEKKRKARSQAKEPVQVETGAIEIESEELEGFTQEEITLMAKVKHDIGTGRYSDITNEHKKLLFVQWLIEHGKLAS